LFVTGLLEQARRCGLRAELVIVEWNPPTDRPRLREVLRWPVDRGPCRVRVIEVPTEIHRRFDPSDRLPLFQMIGKNVGIRRAQGHFILATNMDILFSDEIVRFFASGPLMRGRMYRVDRYDVRLDVRNHVSIDQQLLHCPYNVTRIYSREGTRILGEEVGAAQMLKRRLGAFRHRVERSIRFADRPLHTNACGDFTLMAREHWYGVRGYPEFAVRAFKLDGLLCYAAHYSGARETILKDPMRIYHIDHVARCDGLLAATSEENPISNDSVPQLSRAQYNIWVEQMRRERRPIIFNQNERWGLANETLPETVVVEGILN
jgi:hypothetical protein